MGKTIYDLELHEELVADEYTIIMRVPGGWIYNIKHFTRGEHRVDDRSIPEQRYYSSVFVPFNNDKQPPKHG